MAEEAVDFYRVLQVDPAADPDVIQAAYRVLARKFHPDLVGSDEGMKTLNAAWDTLRDADRRARYDRVRGEQFQAGGGAGATSQPAPSATSAKTLVPDHAGPPPGNPFGPVVTFGRYEGWSLGEIARVDNEFLEWLRGVPAGRGLRDEISTVLRQMSDARGSASRFADGRLPEHKDYFKS
jgi:curved DNA-binding protein CbpA